MFQFGKPALGGADQVVDGRISRAHVLKDFFGGNAAVHHPDAFGLAVLRFDFLQEHSPRRLVGSVSRQHVVGKRE